MSNNTILYQKYRPKKFSEVIGQDNVVRILINEILLSNIANAYIFFGSRGTGKTSVARIFAKAINCENLSDKGDPCNKCLNCKEINSGSYLDLIEIDAASNRGIEDIRELKNKIQFSPVSGKFKVYIIDEVHMLTNDAFNSLLKTLEEPPKNVIFIFATTEINKVPQTIVSRCQRFDFLKASYKDIMTQINFVLKSEKTELNDDIKDLVVTIADGSFRDSMTNLQKILSIYKHDMSYNEVISILNFPDIEFVKMIWTSVISGDLEKVLENIKSNNINVSVFIKNSLDFIRKSMINKTLNYNYYSIDDSVFENIESRDLIKIVNILLNTLEKIKISYLDEINLEISFVSVIDQLGIDVLKSKEEVNEKKTRDMQVENKTKKSITIDENKDLNLNLYWGEIIDKSKTFNHHMSAFLSKSSFMIEENKIIIIVPFSFYKDMLIEKRSKEFLSNLIKDIVGKKYILDCIVDKDIKPIFKNINKINNIDNEIKEVFDLE